MYICRHFTIKELVSRKVYDFYKSYGETFIWGFFDDEIKEDLDIIREAWGKPIIINNWARGGSLSQCGLRSNMDDLVKAKKTPYLSAHCLAKGFDLHDKAGDNQGLWRCCKKLIDFKELKKFHRLENIIITPSWVHVDALGSTSEGLVVFK